MATLLLITVLLPLAASLVLFLGPRRDARSARSIALGTALVTLALSLSCSSAFRTGVVDAPVRRSGEAGGPYGWNWLSRPGIRFALGLDGISLWLFVLTALLHDHGDLRLVGIGAASGRRRITACCWPWRPGCSGSSPASTSSSSTSSSSSR